uniref:Hexosyltransferase n=1 Tax=Pogona vitticeps TaxID=103695 RepID=A0A6J0V2K6_9SAUR
MQLTFCRLRTHQWCFILFNVVLFHILLFGADLVEEYFLRTLPAPYADVKVQEARERARKLDLSSMKANISKAFTVSNSEVCSGKEVFLLVLVFSNPENSTRRDTIRETWANLTHVGGYGTLVLFVLGKPSSEVTQLEVTKESETHQDLIQGVFLDSPGNQTLKILVAMEWTLTFCPTAWFVLKTDEEMFVNLPTLVEYLLNLRSHPEDLYLGRLVHREMPDRDAGSHGFVSPSQYPEKYYPDYCSASAFVLSQDVVRKVYVTSKEAPLSLPPGVFLGICAQKAGVTPVHSSRFSGRKHIQYNRCCYKFIFTSSVARGNQLLQEWEELRNSKDCSLLQTYYGLVSCRVMTYLDGFKHFSIDALQNDALRVSD